MVKNYMNVYGWLLVIVAVLSVEVVNAQESKPWKNSLAFDESFNSLDVTNWGKHGSLWLAHTPWNGDFGQAEFTYDAFNNPFLVSNGILQISATKTGQQRWKSGLLALNIRSPSYKGFELGYFEARMKFPRGPGLWPAFWLIGEDRSRFTAEIDIVEHYGTQADKFSTNAHIWRSHKGGQNTSFHKKVTVDSGILQNQFNLYGVHIKSHELVFYLNRKEFWRIQKPKDFYNMRFYPLINLAMTKHNEKLYGEEYVMEVDYVRVYQ